jgi:hypothetical protein
MDREGPKWTRNGPRPKEEDAMSDDASRVEIQLQTAPVKAVVLVLLKEDEEVFRYLYSADEARAIAGTLLSFADELDPLPIDPDEQLLDVRRVRVARAESPAPRAVMMFDVEGMDYPAIALEPAHALKIAEALVEVVGDGTAEISI